MGKSNTDVIAEIIFLPQKRIISFFNSILQLQLTFNIILC